MSRKYIYALVAIAAFLLGYAVRTPPSNLQAERADSAPMPAAPVTPCPPASLPGASTGREAVSERTPPPMSRRQKADAVRGFLLGDFKSGGEWISFDLFDAEGDITDAFAGMYGLSETEIATLQAKASQIEEELFLMARESSTVSSQDDGSLVISLEPFEGAEELYSNILDGFNDTLGEERFLDFLELGERSLREKFHHFGGEKLNVTVSSHEREYTGDDGRTKTEIRYQVSETSESAGQSSTRRLNDIPQEKFASEFALVKRLIESKNPTP